MHVIKRVPTEKKDEFRGFYFSSDIVQSKVIYTLFAITIALFIISDYMLLNLSLIFYGIVILRASLIVYTLFHLSYLTKIKDYRSYDKSTLIYLIILVTCILLINTSRPENFLSHIIVANLAIFVFYLVVPTRFIIQAIPALIFAVGEILVIMYFSRINYPAVFTAIISLVFTSIVAAIVSIQIHSYRWRVFQDVAERRESERFIAIGQTAGMVGHDIRNPLQTITSSIYLAKEELNSMPKCQEKNAALAELSAIESQLGYINKIVSDLQDFARPLTPELTKINLRALIEDSILSVVIPSNLVVSIDVDSKLDLLLDLTFMRRIITNLLTNAIQAMPQGGKLTIKTIHKDPNVYITIEDTGVGIPEDVKPKIFQPLFTTKSKGQGFGLAVVKRLVEVQGGTIGFESELGKGTRFIIQLPKN